jgi:hypothetical protein
MEWEIYCCPHCALAYYLGMWGGHLAVRDHLSGLTAYSTFLVATGRASEESALTSEENLRDRCPFAHSVQCLCPDEPTAWWHARRR